MEARGVKIDEDIIDILGRLDEACATHPNVAIMWRSYILRKLRRLQEDVSRCDILLTNTLPEMGDIPLSTLILLGHIPLDCCSDFKES